MVHGITNDASVHYSQFDVQGKNNFIEVWELRLKDAIDYHKRDDLRRSAEGILAFVKERPSCVLRLYVYMEGQERQPIPKHCGFLFDTQTKEYFQIL